MAYSDHRYENISAIHRLDGDCSQAPKCIDMQFKTTFLINSLLILQGCTGISMLAINDEDAKGQPLEKVTTSITDKGLSCSEEYKIRDLGGKPYGLVICGATGDAPICPTSYSVRIIFDLEMRVVHSLAKSERENCF